MTFGKLSPEFLSDTDSHFKTTGVILVKDGSVRKRRPMESPVNEKAEVISVGEELPFSFFPCQRYKTELTKLCLVL